MTIVAIPLDPARLAPRMGFAPLTRHRERCDLPALPPKAAEPAPSAAAAVHK